MKIKKILVPFLCGCLFTTSLSSCSEPENVSSSSSSSSDSTSNSGSGGIVDKEVVVFTFDDKSQIKEDSTLFYSDNLSNEYLLDVTATVNGNSSKVEITSKNVAVAIVEGNKVKLVGSGEVDIVLHAKSAKTNEKDKTIHLTVLNEPKLDVSFSKTFVKIGETTEVTTEILDTVEGVRIEYLSSDPATIKVDDNGVVTGVTTGRATITINLYVNDKLVDTVEQEIVCSDEVKLILNQGKDVEIYKKDKTASLSVEIGNIDLSTVNTYEVSTKEVPTNFTATYNKETGKLDIVLNDDALGNVKEDLTLILKYKEAEDSEETVVESNKVTVSILNTISIKFDVEDTNQTINFGETVTYGVIALINEEETTEYEFSSSNTSVATIDSTGKVTTVGDGSTTLKVTLTGYEGENAYAEIHLTVNPSYSLTLNNKDLTVSKDAKFKLNATFTKNGKKDTNPIYTIEFSETSLASFNPETKEILAVNVGTTTATVTYGDQIDTFTLTVIGKVTITPDEQFTNTNINWNEKNALTTEEILSNFTVAQEGNPEYASKLVVNFVKGDEQSFNTKTPGTYQIVIATEDGLAETSVYTIEIVPNIDVLTLYYFDKKHGTKTTEVQTEGYDAYVEMTGLYSFGSTGVSYYIEGLTEGQETEYKFREIVKLNESGVEDVSGTYEVLKFTIDTSLLYNVSTEWNGSNIQSKKLSFEELNSGIIFRDASGNTQTMDYNYTLANASDSTIYCYNDSNVNFKSMYNGLSFSRYNANDFVKLINPNTIDVSTIKGIRVLTSYKDHSGAFNNIYIFGRNNNIVNTSLVNNIEVYNLTQTGDSGRYSGTTFTFGEDIGVTNGWNYGDNSTMVKFVLEDFTKIIVRNDHDSNSQKSVDLLLDIDLMKATVSSDGYITLLFLETQHQGGNYDNPIEFKYVFLHDLSVLTKIEE